MKKQYSRGPHHTPTLQQQVRTGAAGIPPTTRSTTPRVEITVL